MKINDGLMKFLREEFDSLPKSETTPFDQSIDADSIQEEQMWIEAYHSDCEIIKQSLVFHKEKPYDIFTLKKQNGEHMELIFDISRFFGKEGR